jgi:hypothetical protein
MRAMPSIGSTKSPPRAMLQEACTCTHACWMHANRAHYTRHPSSTQRFPPSTTSPARTFTRSLPLPPSLCVVDWACLHARTAAAAAFAAAAAVSRRPRRRSRTRFPNPLTHCGTCTAAHIYMCVCVCVCVCIIIYMDASRRRTPTRTRNRKHMHAHRDRFTRKHTDVDSHKHAIKRKHTVDIDLRSQPRGLSKQYSPTP